MRLDERPESTHQKYKVLLVDDHPILRHGLADLIESETDLEVCGECSGVSEALGLLREKALDLIIVDLKLKEGSGLDLIEQVAGLDAPPKILVCSVHDEMLFAERCLRAGASGYIQKEEATEKLIEAIHQVIQGKIYSSESVSEQVMNQLASAHAEGPASPIDTLSNRELQVFELIGQGYSTREVAEQLHLSRKTIETYREKIKEKLNIDTGSQLVQRAVQWVLEER
ncbi:MAG: response regulator transcription factor [Candidatus Hydrogenedentota bacterium]